MFQSEKQPQSINFLEAIYSPSDVWSNAYVWLVNIGKYMLIAVEVVVLGVFFSRFVLDRKNNDLTEEVIIRLYYCLMKTGRRIQSYLRTIKLFFWMQRR